jgi:5'-nucleotidase
VYKDVLEEREDSQGRSYYLIGGDIPSGVAEEGTDYTAVLHNRISITPIHLDLTNHRLIKKLADWNLQAEWKK